MKNFNFIAVLVLVSCVAMFLFGCGRDSDDTASVVTSSGASTQPAAGAADTGITSPDVGIKAMTPEQFKPVVGTYGGRIVRDTLGEPKSFNPVTAGETSTTEYTGRIFQGLTDTDPFTGEVMPLLAEKWEVADDGVTWTFHLRKDVTFNDGSPLTSSDVVFTWNDLVYDLSRPQGTDPRWPCSMRDIATFEGKIVQVEAVDDYTVRFVTPYKVAIWDQMVAEGILSRKKYEPMVKSGAFGGALGADSKASDLVGTGPFILGEYIRGQRVVLKRNPNYWKKDSDGNKLPYLDELVFQITRDLNTMLLDFEQGITDIFTIPSGKEVARLKPMQKEGNFSLYQFGPDDGTVFLALNMNEAAAKAGKVAAYKVKWFRDQRFRQALSYAIDRGAQVRNIRRNLGYPQSAPFTLSAGPYRQEGFSPYPYDPEKAKALLAEMGFKPGSDGILRDPAGHKVSFTLNTNAGNYIREESANFIRKDLERVGIEVNILFLEFNLLVDKMDETYDWEALVMGLTGGREPHWGANVWKSDGRLHMWWPEQATPGTDWEKRIDEIFAAGIQELDKAKRKEIYREYVEIVHREQPFIYLTVSEQVAALRNRFGNIFPSPIGGLLHNEDQIFVKSAK
jgi:peptide/nickel transport system substrate-binding protein